MEIDLLRGIAIFCAVIANYSPYFIDNPFGLLKLIYTFAAPLFVSITGFLMYKNKSEKNYGWGYFIHRGTLLIIIACLLEMIGFRLYPLISFDVLYLIGFCTIIFILLYNLWKIIGFWLIIIIFSVSILLQTFLGYSKEVIEYSLNETISISEFLGVFIRQSLIDGYFPIFPWTGIFILGFCLYEKNFKNIILKFANLWVISFVFLSYFLVNSGRHIRAGYAELFYPPDWIFILWVLTFIFTFFYMTELKVLSHLGLISRFWETIGKSPLFFYIFHLLFVEYFWKNFSLTSLVLSKKELYLDFVLSLVFTFLIMGLIAILFKKLKRRKLPFIVKFFIGS